MTARHAAPRTTPRAVPATKGPGRHAAGENPAPLTELVPVADAAPAVTQAPMAFLIALVALLLLAVGIGTAAATGAARMVEPAPSVAVAPWDVDTATDQPADSIEEDEPGWNCTTMGNHACGPLTGTDAGLITAPAN